MRHSRPLTLNIPTAEARIEKIPLNGHQVMAVERYQEYWLAQTGQVVSVPQLLAEMIASFIAADGTFKQWCRTNPVQKKTKKIEA
jgi:hypothetical protein